MTPILSIIVTVYQAEPYLRQCVDSILAQTLEDIQLILVDDGSSDGSPAICDEYAARDPRVRVIHKPNGGPVSAWRAGILAAGADYVGFVDSDDWVDPTYFEELYAAITAHGADIVEGQYTRHGLVGGVWRSVRSTRSRTTVYEGEEDIRRLTELYITSFLYDGVPDKPDRPLTYSQGDKLYRRALFLANLDCFPEHQTLGEDAIANYAVLPDCERVVTIPCRGRYNYRIRPGSISHQSGEEQLPPICSAYDALHRLADAKGLDPAGADAFVGSMVYTRLYRAASAPGESAAARCGRVKRILGGAPAGCLREYVRVRGGLSLRLYCTLLRLGLAAPCVWLTGLHARRGGSAS